MTTALTVTVSWTSTVTKIESAFVTMMQLTIIFNMTLFPMRLRLMLLGWRQTFNMTVIATATVTLKMILTITILCH